MNKIRNATIIVLLSAVLLLGAYDIYAAFFGDHATISHVIWDYSLSYPIIPFLFGCLIGHLFLPRTVKTG